MHSESEIAVGLSISLTGQFARQGQQVLAGTKLWQSYVNAQGGISISPGEQRRVRIVSYDDQSRLALLRNNLLRMIRQDRVSILFGPYSSALTLAAAELAEEHGKILWNHGGASDEIFCCGYRLLVSTLSPASDYLRMLPHWLVKHPPERRRICIVHSARGTFAAQVARGVVEAATQMGMHSPEILPVTSPLENTDRIAQRLRGTSPVVLILAASFQDEIRILRTRPFWPVTVSCVAAVSAGVQGFYGEIGEAAEGVLGPSQWEPTLDFGEIEGPHSDWFVRNFQARFHRAADYTAAGAFATGMILTECIRRAKSPEDARLREIAAGLDLRTFYGRFRIDLRSGCQTGHGVLLVQWQNGRKVVVARDERSEA